MAKKRIKRNDRYSNTYNLGGWMNGVNNKIDASSFGKAIGGSSGLGGITNAATSIVSGLINPRGNSTGVGNTLKGIGSIASNIPGIGGVIGAGVNLVGGLVNATFGSNLNEEFIAQTEDKTKQQAGYISSAEDNASLLSDWTSYTDMAHVKRSDVGSDGWFSNKAKNKTKSLNRAIDEANLRAWHSLNNTASNVDTNNDFLAMANFSAYGGPIFSTGAIGYDLASRDLNNKQMKALGDMRLTSLHNSFNAMPDVSTINTFKDGGIFIKPENRGKFTALKERTGKSSTWYKEHGTPAQKKMATFALNARKWKHDDGGYMNPTTTAGILAKTALQLVDPTGVSSYPDLYNSGVQFYNNPSLENFGDLGLNFISSLPLIGKATAPFKASKTAKLLSKLGDLNTAKKSIEAATKVNKKIDTFSELIPGVRPLAEKVQNITTELISDPLFNRLTSKNKNIRIKNYRDFNLGVDLLNTTNTGTDFYQGMVELNEKAFGGDLLTHGTEWDNGLTVIDNGGTHEQNPYEGVQMGIDPQGVPNLVEEGEVIFNDYVFSNRLKVPKAIRQKYRLRDNITFADAAKKLSKESEDRPNDPISKRGLETFMSALANSQEEVRIKNEGREMNRYAKGGKLGNLFDGTGNKSNRLNPYSNFVPLTDDSFYTPEYMDFWNWYNTNQSTPEGQAWLKRINSGEFGPIGGNTFAPQDIIRLSHDYKQGPVHNAFAAAAKQYNIENPKEDPYTPYTKRWIREKGADGEWRTQQITDEEWNSAPAGRTYLMRNTNLKEGNTVTSDRGDKDIYYDVIPEELPEELTGDVTEVKGIRQNPLRYAPLIGSGIAVLNDIFGDNDPDYSNADMFASAIRNANRPVGTRPIGEYLAYKPLDRMFYINQLNRNAAAGRRAIQNTSGGNRAAALAGILAEDYNYGENLGKLARQAEEYNQALKEKVTGFNRQTNMFNSEQGTKVDMFNSELLGKQASLYGQLANMRQRILEGNRAEKSANLTNFIQGLGDLGRELTDRDTLRWLADIGALPYNTRGQYTGGNNTAAPKKSKSSKSKKNKKKGYTV